MTDWQPIATAPKDGTDLLVFVIESGEQFVAYYFDNCFVYARYPTVGKIACTPDFWMPLPNPPV